MKDKPVTGQTNLAPPWQPASVEPMDIQAIRAIARGEATKDQQVRFTGWLKRASAVEEMSYRPASERDSAFAEGKRFVGLQFFSLANTFLPDPRQGT